MAGLQRPVVIDEVQRVPDLLLAIKQTVDRDNTPGQFLLTGSSHVLTLPQLADSLAGRMDILQLRPFSQGELEGRDETFLDDLFHEASFLPGTNSCVDVMDRAQKGGYPEVQDRDDASRRDAWFRAYLHSMTERDIRDLAQVDRLPELPRVLQILGSYAGGLVNFAQLSRDTAIPQTTLKRYIALLEAVFLIEQLPAWAASQVSRLIKAPKLYVTDSGLLTYLLGSGNVEFGRNRGAIYETFVLMELRKLASYSKRKPSFYHYRTASGLEVDFVLESGTDLVGVEAKASATVGPNDFKGLHALRESVGDRFRRGVVLYLGQEVVPFARDLHAVPVSRLWTSSTAGDSATQTAR